MSTLMSPDRVALIERMRAKKAEGVSEYSAQSVIGLSREQYVDNSLVVSFVYRDAKLPEDWGELPKSEQPTNTVPIESVVDREANAVIEDAKPVMPEHEAKSIEPEGAAREAEEFGDGPLTEKEAIRLVEEWAELDENLDPSKRETAEEMYKNLLAITFNRDSNVSNDRLNEIVATYAPNAPCSHANEKHKKHDSVVSPPYPLELDPLVKSGIARCYEGIWVVNRCSGCGQFRNECCGRIIPVSAIRIDGQTLTALGRQAVGLDPIRRPAPPQSLDQILQERMVNIQNEPCWNQFRSVSELEGNGTVKMYIENFLPEGTTLICGLPKEGKSFLALSAAKALTTGEPLFGRRGYEVPEIVPVLYLAAESGDGALKLRCKKFGITEDKTRFIARTLTQGVMLGLNSPEIESILKVMHPVVILETLIRFNDGNDEDDASENRKLAESIFHLIALGARAVLGIHHSRKDVKANPTKEAAVRGSGDALAMVDAVWLVLQDEKLFQGGKGPNEIDVVGWGRDFGPAPMRLALTKKAPKDLPPGTLTYAPGLVSCLDTQGNFQWVDKIAQETKRLEFGQELERLITENPFLSLEELSRKTEHSVWEVRKALKKLGYQRARGGKPDETSWTKEV